MEGPNKSNFNSQFRELQSAGYRTTKRIYKSVDPTADILKDLNKKDHHGHRGIKIIIRGSTTEEYNAALISILRQKEWDVAFLSDIYADPKEVLGLMLNRDVFITTLNPKRLVEEGYNVIRVDPPVVIPTEDTNLVSSPSIKPILVFIGVFAVIIVAAWAVWKMSQ